MKLHPEIPFLGIFPKEKLTKFKKKYITKDAGV
jgi:hypothetical protein